MISQSAYLALCKYVNFASENRSECFPEVPVELEQFCKPRVLVIHRPSGRGFYLDRQYRYIVDVKNCQEPENPTDVEKESFCTHSPPDWTYVEKSEEFDSFWLY